MGKKFKFYEYEFSDSLSSLKVYLNEKEIEYIQNNAFISFNIDCVNCKEPVEVKAYYKDDSILNLVLNCYPISFNNRQCIEEELNKYYEKKTDEIGLKEFLADDYYILFKYSENVQITVEFKALDNEARKRIRNEKLRYQVPFVAIGAILSGLFITLYFCFKQLVWLHITTSIIGIIYAYFELYYMYIKRELLSKTGKKVAMIVIPILFAVIVSLVSIFFAMRITDGDISSFNWIDFVMIIVYMLPSFNILLIIMAGLSYA